jgi:hypothetical protein
VGALQDSPQLGCQRLLPGVAARLAGLADARHIAEQMFLHEHTVRDHVESTFADVGSQPENPEWRCHKASQAPYSE